MIITHKICMDLTRRMLQPPIQVMQDDQYSRELEFLLTANGEPWEIPKDFSAMIRWHRESDKVGGSYDLMPDGSLAYSKRENVLTVQLLPQICAGPGKVYLTIMLASANAVAHTFTIPIDVQKNPGLQESVPAPAPDEYQQLLHGYAMMSARVNNLASLEEGSTTGDAELIDGRMDHAGQVHTNIGSHIRKIGGIANDLYGTKTVTISRAGEVAAELEAVYVTVLEVVGTARYLEKVRVPVQVTGQYSSIYAAIASKENTDQPIVRKDVEISASGQTVVDLEVGRWFSPGEKIVVEIGDTERFKSLLLPTTQEEIASDWLEDCPGSVCDLNEDTGDWLFDRENIKFVGELIFYDTLREELLQMEECTVSCKEQNFSEEQQAQARKNIGITNDTDIHAQFFTITDDGVVSLKPEYRGACPSNRNTFTYAISDNGIDAAGSKNTYLPKYLVIPELVDEIAVVSLAPGMFMQNQAVEGLTLPDSVTEIPERFCDFAINLKNIRNTEQIEKIGNVAFQSVSLEKIKCPNLTSLGMAAFNNCPFLKYADIGNVTTIPNSAFAGTSMLSRIKGGAGVTTIEVNALRSTKRLNKVDFLEGLTTVGANAIHCSALDCSWARLSTTDIWTGCKVTAKENPLPTLLSQQDPRWADETIGGTETKYRVACVLFTVMHAYCALHNLTLSTVDEFVAIINQKDPDILNTVFSNGGQNSDVPELCTALGLSCTTYQNYGQTELQAVYDAIAQGKYVFVAIPAPTSHAVLAYGAKENGEFMIADSSFGAAETVGRGDLPIKYSIPYQNITTPTSLIHIISRTEE